MAKNIVLGLFLLAALAGGGKAIASERTCQMPGDADGAGLPKCVLGGGSGNATQSDDPDMGGREGVPPNSVGSGTRVEVPKFCCATSEPCGGQGAECY
jgi:hypothetical protein